MRIQLTLTVPESKRFIAKGIGERVDVKHAYEHGKILFKGGTTVSVICEELYGIPLRISGRVTPNRTKSAKTTQKGWHCALSEKGALRDIAK